MFQYILTEMVKGCQDSYKMNSSTCNSCLMSNTSLTLQTSTLVPVTDSLVSSISSFLLENPKTNVENKFGHSCNCIKEFFLDRNLWSLGFSRWGLWIHARPSVRASVRHTISGDPRIRFWWFFAESYILMSLKNCSKRIFEKNSRLPPRGGFTPENAPF